MPIPWRDAEGSLRAIERNARLFSEQAGNNPWAVVWAAGNAANASTQSEVANELRTFQATLSSLKNNLPVGNGVFFLSSSAGGVYAGSDSAPFTDRSVTKPLSPYGELKLAQEERATQELQGMCALVIGRISNLYGPGQNLDKLQGLISRLALAAITKQVVNMFVSLDTLRDYIYVDDAAAVILDSMGNALCAETLTARTEVIASGRPVSLGYLIHLMQEISRTKIPVAYGSHASAASQSRDLRLIPSHQHEVEHLIKTPLSVGTKSVYLDVLERFQYVK